MARPFLDILRELSGGRTHDELTEALADLTEQVLLSRAAGSLTLKLTVKPNGETGVIINDKVSVLTPSQKRGDTIFFVAAGGNLQRNDPRQVEMFKSVKAVPEAPQPAPIAVPVTQPGTGVVNG